MFPSILSRFFRLFSAIKFTVGPIGGGMSLPETTEKATFAAGCFWGVEHLFRKHFTGKGLLDARVGYIGGDTTHPTYHTICSGKTGHAEALQIVYNPSAITYEKLLEFFFKMHDPVTVNRQGPDVGSQYRSAIFFHNEQQEKTAREVLEKVGAQWYKVDLATQVIPAGDWWDAEDYHQLYLENNPGGYECPSHYVRGFEPLT
jgi:peptide-methionine (S)-S-oxide reductase